jgi:hypothetical protein
MAAYSPARMAHAEAPAIEFETHGLDRGRGNGGPVYTLSVFGDGTVVYRGLYRTRVSGEARATVAPETVARWLGELIADGVFEARDDPTHVLPADVTWYRLTVAANGRRASFRFMGWFHPGRRFRVLEEMLLELDVRKKWVNRE